MNNKKGLYIVVVILGLFMGGPTVALSLFALLCDEYITAALSLIPTIIVITVGIVCIRKIDFSALETRQRDKITNTRNRVNSNRAQVMPTSFKEIPDTAEKAGYVEIGFADDVIPYPLENNQLLDTLNEKYRPPEHLDDLGYRIFQLCTGDKRWIIRQAILKYLIMLVLYGLVIYGLSGIAANYDTLISAGIIVFILFNAFWFFFGYLPTIRKLYRLYKHNDNPQYMDSRDQEPWRVLTNKAHLVKRSETAALDPQYDCEVNPDCPEFKFDTYKEYVRQLSERNMRIPCNDVELNALIACIPYLDMASKVYVYYTTAESVRTNTAIKNMSGIRRNTYMSARVYDGTDIPDDVTVILFMDNKKYTPLCCYEYYRKVYKHHKRRTKTYVQYIQLPCRRKFY